MFSIQSDIAIVGGGPVGAAFAAAMAGSRFSLALMEPRQPVRPDAWDIRIYAISPQNRAFLERLGAWGRLDRTRMCPVRRMLVFGGDGAQLEFSAYDNGVAELAWIVEAGAMTHALWEQMRGQGNLQLLCPCAPEALHRSEATVRLATTNAGEVQARLVVGADGARSFVREAAGLTSKAHPDRQMGVVANFECERPHGNTAFQWFRADGVLAWLPLPGHRLSMVWSTSETNAHELRALSSEELCERVAAAGHGLLGTFRPVTAAEAFPIARLAVPDMTAARIALMGDAAHVVHPLAGQGVNLGLQDAAALAAVLAHGRVRDPGAVTGLRRYERMRKEDVLVMRSATDGLDWLFHSDAPGIRNLRRSGLKAVNSLPLVKSMLTRHALG